MIYFHGNKQAEAVADAIKALLPSLADDETIILRAASDGEVIAVEGDGNADRIIEVNYEGEVNAVRCG